MISIENLTKDYGEGKGIFDVNLKVNTGEVFGFLGPNGAGKTTTIRHLMGFIRPDLGKCSIDGMDCYKDVVEIQRNLGYLAGEIVFFNDMTGMEMIDFVAGLKGVTDRKIINELISRFELNTSVRIRKMSKGMKQKIGIICAFMNDPQIIILDEPTSGLDPLMQNKFVELILEQKEKGKTIFMSSHIFEEVERTCDRVAIIKDGKIISVENMTALKETKIKTYVIDFKNNEDIQKYFELNKDRFKSVNQDGKLVNVTIKGDVTDFVNSLNGYSIRNLDIHKETLEELFMHFYGMEEK